MTSSARFPYIGMNSALGGASLMPMVPLVLANGKSSLDIYALLDTGATVNVLPYSVGKQLGAVWEQQTTELQLTGGLAGVPARVLILSGSIETFAPVRLAFAWAQHDSMPVISGQTNFFLEFDVCFFRSRSEFEVRPKT